MRFEIRTGGAILILFGLLALSGAVFGLGLIAGYEMARQNAPDSSQVASVFPLPTAPPVQPTPSPTPAAAISAAPSAAIAAATPASRPSVKARATASPAVASRTRPTPGEIGGATETPRTVANAPEPAVTPALRKHPYNIQIEGVMDKSSADAMMARMRTLGFPAVAYPTNVNGQTWYRVKVGPYETQEEARAAQEKLRTEYKSSASH